VAKKTPRPGRTLLIFGLVIVVLYGLAALGGTWKPKLGLDLEGGTRITLSAIQQDQAITQTKLKQAASIVDARVNGSGVSEAEVSTQGNRNIIVEIPGRNASSLVDSVKRTAQLRFRIVAGQPQPGVPVPASPSASPSGSTSPSASPSGGSSASPSTTPTPKVSKSSATPKPRVAPFATASPAPRTNATAKANAKAKATTTPKPSASPTPATPSQSQAPTQTATGASVDDPVAWAQNPGTEWLQKYAAFTCPGKGQDAAPVQDRSDQPLLACDDQGQKFLLSKAVIEGTSLKSASYGIPNQGAAYVVNLGLKGPAVKTFADISTTLNGNGGTFAIVLDGLVVSYAGFNSPILDGNAQIEGNFTESSARSLANSLKYGALPLKFTTTTETVGPSLAGNQLSAGILAGVIGLLIVMLYCLLYYRGLGFVVIASLVIAAAVTYAVVLVLAKTAGFTLTLPGIAGLIVAVGITADSFIVYFERIRDEMREGRSMRVAVETGWARARNTCLAADAVSLLAAIVLYIFAIGVVRGFAFALGISTIIDIAVFFFFTKPMMTYLARRRFFNTGHRLSGLSSETLGIDEPTNAQLVGGRA
jgi:preprotein translocase subunit SecD